MGNAGERLTSRNARGGMVIAMDVSAQAASHKWGIITNLRHDGFAVKLLCSGPTPTMSYPWAELDVRPIYIVPLGPCDSYPWPIPVRANGSFLVELGAEVCLLHTCDRLPIAVGEVVATTLGTAVVRWGTGDSAVLEAHDIAGQHSGLMYAPNTRLQKIIAPHTSSVGEVLSRSRKPPFSTTAAVPGHDHGAQARAVEALVAPGVRPAMGPALDRALGPSFRMPRVEPIALPPRIAPTEAPRWVADLASAARAAHAPSAPMDDPAKACVVCMSNVRDYVCLPCMHTAYCGDCVDAARQQAPECPLCRTATAFIVRVFF